LGFEPKSRTEERGNFGKPLAMPVRRRVARFDAARQAKKHRFGVFELVRVILQAQQRTSAGQQLAEVDWLAEKIVRARVDALNAIRNGRQTGNQNHRREARLGHSFDAAANFKSVET